MTLPTCKLILSRGCCLSLGDSGCEVLAGVVVVVVGTLVRMPCRFHHISAGDCLREERASGSADADLINTFIKEGKIVPVEITIKLLLKAMEVSGNSKFLIDGEPTSGACLQPEDKGTEYRGRGGSALVHPLCVAASLLRAACCVLRAACCVLHAAPHALLLCVVEEL